MTLAPLVLGTAAICALWACKHPPAPADKPTTMEEVVTARVTYYLDHRTAIGVRPVSGETVAVDPKLIPYGTRITIPEIGESYTAQDTGPAVVKRTASKRLGRKNIVIDVYCATRAEMRRHIRNNPMFMKVVIHRPAEPKGKKP